MTIKLRYKSGRVRRLAAKYYWDGPRIFILDAIFDNPNVVAVEVYHER